MPCFPDCLYDEFFVFLFSPTNCFSVDRHEPKLCIAFESTYHLDRGKHIGWTVINKMKGFAIKTEAKTNYVSWCNIKDK